MTFLASLLNFKELILMKTHKTGKSQLRLLVLWSYEFYFFGLRILKAASSSG